MCTPPLLVRSNVHALGRRESSFEGFVNAHELFPLSLRVLMISNQEWDVSSGDKQPFLCPT
jgi:hypothetical protein